MSKALSLDPRDRVIAAIEGGMSCRQAAARFGVRPASPIRWRSRLRTQCDVRPGPLGGDRRNVPFPDSLFYWAARPESSFQVYKLELTLKLPERRSGSLFSSPNDPVLTAIS
jgi:hypothetical protein